MNDLFNKTMERHVSVQLDGAYHNKSGSQTILCLTGKPGTGKTQGIAQFAKWYGEKTSQKVGVFTFILAQSDNCDFGAPVPNHNENKLDMFIPQRILGHEQDALDHTGKYTMGDCDVILIFFDEIGNATPATLAALQSLLEDRTLHGQKVSRKVAFVCATNLPEHGCNAKALPQSFTQGRVSMIDVDKFTGAESWLEWAAEAGIDPRIQTVIHIRPDLMDKFDAKKKSTPQICGRSLEKLSKLIEGVDDYELIEILGYGAIGDEWSVVSGYFKFGSDMPTIQEVIDSPDTAKVPGRQDPAFATSGQHAVIGNIAHFLSEKKRSDESLSLIEADNIAKYLNRLPGEVMMMGLRLCKDSHPEFCESPTYTAMTVDNQWMDSSNAR